MDEANSSIILYNAATCMLCGRTATSTGTHYYATCTCQNVSADGGFNYIKRSAANVNAYKEMSVSVPSNCTDMFILNLYSIYNLDCYLEKLEDYLRGYMPSINMECINGTMTYNIHDFAEYASCSAQKGTDLLVILNPVIINRSFMDGNIWNQVFSHIMSVFPSMQAMVTTKINRGAHEISDEHIFMYDGLQSNKVLIEDGPEPVGGPAVHEILKRKVSHNDKAS